MADFRRKGRFGEMLGRIPVYVMASDVALLGAAVHALGLAKTETTEKKKS
jgi:glucokinase